MRRLHLLLVLLVAFALAACPPARRGRGSNDDDAANDDDSAADDDDAVDDDDSSPDDDDATGDDDDATADDDDATADDDDATGDDDDSVPGSQTFTFTGAVQTFVVPPGVTSIFVEAYGGSGGDALTPALGGLGGYAEADIAVTPGESLEVYVGGAGASLVTTTTPGGWNGGGGIVECCGNGESGTGGGASDVRRGSSLSDRLIVAAGGGGGGWDDRDAWGGDGGGLTGEDGNTNFGKHAPGFGATQTAGGAAGWSGPGYPNTGGSFGIGGDCWIDGAGCGGGGGGWYGGGAGGFAGGGGGSSYVGAVGTTNGSTVSGLNSGDGSVSITW